jgi:hypothetical protein
MKEDPTGLSEKAEAAFRKVAARVIQRARQTGTPVVVWENNRVKEIPCEEFEQSAKSWLRRQRRDGGRD